MDPVACRPIITGSCPLSVVKNGYTAFPRPNVTLSGFLPAKNERKKGNRSGLSSVVSWSDSPREQSEANSEDAVMEDGTETHQAEINKNDKLRKILTNMPKEHRTLIYGDSFKSKMESLDDEKAALLAAKRQFLPLQSRIDKQKNFLERVSKEIESKHKTRLEILQKWIEADQELETANA